MYNPMYNHRIFIYRNREDIDAFLEEGQLWRDLYDVFLRTKDNTYYLKISSARMFNEVRYQCVRVMLDKHPEENIWRNYLNDARDRLGWRYASDLCFSMVYAVLSLLKNPPEQVVRFCKVLHDSKLKTEPDYFPDFDTFVREYKQKGICYDIDLSAEAESPSVIRSLACLDEHFIIDSDWWRKITSNFEQQSIRDIVSLWNDKEEKLEIVNMIEDAFDYCIQQEEEEKRRIEEQNDLPF